MRPIVNTPALVLLLAAPLWLMSCSTPKTAPAEEPVEAVEAEQPDPGPAFERRRGKRESVVREAGQASSVLEFADEGHYYMQVELDTELLNNVAWDWVEVATERHGVAFLAHPNVLIRFVGPEEPPEEFEMHMFGSLDNQHDKVGASDVTHIHQPVVVSGTNSAASEPELPTNFWNAMARFFRPRGPGAPLFYTYVRHRANRELAPESVAVPPRRRSELGSLMATYTGALSVEEALQTDRALLVRAAPASERTIDIAEVEGIGLPEHPWEQMMKELNTAPVIEPLAAVVPYDMLYLHFDDLRTFVKLASDLDQWVTPLVQAMEGKAGSRHFTDRYETQLAIQRSGLSRELGHLAARSVALTTSDPFLREGTDVSVLFDVRDRKLLMTALKRYEDETRKRFPALAEGSYTVGEHTVRTLTTPDGAVGQHRIELGEVLILSNSRAAIERFVTVSEGEATSLKDSGDFQYMRARYPHDPKNEDGFVFIGDAFVTNAVNPQLKILSARRMEAQADLVNVNQAALLFGWLEGRRPANAGELVEHGLLQPEELLHPEGDAITFDPARGATSSWGTAASMKPLVELTLDKVTPHELQAYQRFRNSYLGIWHTFIDPIAARISYEDNGQKIAVDARMLPLVQESEYNTLQRQVGARTTTPPTIEGAVQWTLAVGDDAALRRELNMLARQMTGNNKLGLDWLGDWVMVGAADRSGLWDLALGANMVLQAGQDMGFSNEALEQVVHRFPLYVGAHIKNPVGLAATLTALRTFAEGAAPGLLVWDVSESHRDIAITTIRGTDEFSSYALHYSVAGRVIIFSLELETLKTLMSAALDGKLSSEPASEDAELFQTMITLRPKAAGQSWLMKTLAGVLETNTALGHAAAEHHFMVLSHGLPDAPKSAQAAREEAVAFVGVQPEVAHGGEFSLDEYGRVQHSIYGKPGPLYPELPVEGSPVTRVLSTLVSLGMQLGFEGEGDHRGLHTRIEWERDDSRAPVQ